jgi:hypothetical protein
MAAFMVAARHAWTVSRDADYAHLRILAERQDPPRD